MPVGRGDGAPRRGDRAPRPRRVPASAHVDQPGVRGRAPRLPAPGAHDAGVLVHRAARRRSSAPGSSRRASSARCTRPSTRSSASCRCSRSATDGTSAACRWRCTRRPVSRRSSCTTATRAVPASPSSRSPTSHAHVARRARARGRVPVRRRMPVVRAVAEVRELERVPRQGRRDHPARGARRDGIPRRRTPPAREVPGDGHEVAQQPARSTTHSGRTSALARPRAGPTSAPQAGRSTSTTTSALVPEQSHETSRASLLAAVWAAAARAAPARRRARAVGGRERGGVGGRLGPGPTDERAPESRRTGGQHEPEHEHRQHHDAHAAALAAPHFSTRITDVACRSGSGNSTPTSGRSVTDV